MTTNTKPHFIAALMLLLSLFLSHTSMAERSEQVEYPTYYAHVNDISIAYQEFGNPEDETIILVMGLGGQLIHWDDDLVWKLVDAGFHVVRFDNRDAGWSSKLYDADTPNVITGIKYKLGLSLNAPYSLDDMAADAIGLLNYLEVESAHAVGMSMGGMIAQIMAGKYPEKIKSLTSIMSTSGAEHLPQGTLGIDTDARAGTSREDVIAASAKFGQKLDGTVAELSEAEWLTLQARSYDRSHYPDGFARQMWAIGDAGDRVALLKNITQPTLVIHGKDDQLIPVEHGTHTAELVNNSRLVLLDGMGHFIDRVNKPAIINEIIKLASEQP